MIYLIVNTLTDDWWDNKEGWRSHIRYATVFTAKEQSTMNLAQDGAWVRMPQSILDKIVFLEKLCEDVEKVGDLYAEKRSDVADIIEDILKGRSPKKDWVDHRYVTWNYGIRSFVYDTLTTMVDVIDAEGNLVGKAQNMGYSDDDPRPYKSPKFYLPVRLLQVATEAVEELLHTCCDDEEVLALKKHLQALGGTPRSARRALTADEKEFIKDVIAPVLVETAIDGTLPMDKTEIDWSFFVPREDSGGAV